MWRFEGNHLINERGQAVDVSGGVDSEGRNVIVWNKHNGLNQQFDIKYLDEYKGEPSTGQLNADWGFYVNRDFYIQSMLPSGRVLQYMNSGHAVSLKAKNYVRNYQKWYFDQRTRTIRCRQNNYALEIAGNGRSRNLRAVGANSHWW